MPSVKKKTTTSRKPTKKPSVTASAKKKWGDPFLKLIPKGYDLISLLGQGKMGHAYMICRGKHTPCHVFKVQKVVYREYIEEEIAMQRKFHSLGLAPKIYNVQYYKVKRTSSRKNNNTGSRKTTTKTTEYAVIEMDKIDGVLKDWLAVKRSHAEIDGVIKGCLDIMKKMCKNKLTHGDMHNENIAYTINQAGKLKLILIDFGFASQGKCTPALELIQMLRTVGMHKKGTKSVPSNVHYMEEQLLDIYRDNYNPNLENIEDAWDDEWDALYEEYAHSSL